MQKTPEYHQPVLLKESIDALAIRPDGLYLDLTFGGGGHAREILKKLDGKGRLIAFDQDEDVLPIAGELKEQFAQFTLIQANFRYVSQYLKLYQVSQVDGILADLGISSHQIDTPERGFSTRFQAKLDMRMDHRNALTAADIIHTYTEEQLHKVLGMYGEIKNAKTVANALVRQRIRNKIHTVDDLKNLLLPFAPKGPQAKFFAQVFQAFRIEVNEELKALGEMLEQSPELIKKGGRLVVISYHSLEDRLVKNFLSKGKLYGEASKDLYGNVHLPFKSIYKKPLEASEEEIQQNKRARSARLRAGKRI